MMKKLIPMLALAIVIPASASAHVSVWPRESRAGATEKYTVRVPNESKVASTALELEVPDGVTVETLAMPAGWKHEVKKKDDRIVGVTWTMTIPPGEFAEFSFIALNPLDGPRLVWTVRQRFADGTVEDFTKNARGEVRPTVVTTLTPRPAAVK